MRVFRLAASNALAFWRRFLGLALVAALGTGICLPLLAIAADAETAAHERITEGVLLRSIELLRANDLPGGATISPKAVDEIAKLTGVSSVEPSIQATIGIKTATVEGALLHATMPRPSRLPPILTSSRPNPFPLAADEIVLPAKAQGMDLTGLLGTKITVDYTERIGPGEGRGARDQVTVVGIFDPAWQIDGLDSAYAADGKLMSWAAASAGVPKEVFLTTHGYDRATVVAASADDVPSVLAELQSRSFSATSLQQQLTELPSVLRLIKLVSRVLTGALIVFIVLGAAALSSSLVRQRTREIGLLKAVGYRTRSVLTMFLLEQAVVGLVAGLVGLGIGLVGGRIFISLLERSPDLSLYVGGRLLPPVTQLLPLVLIPAVAMIIGGLLPARRGAAMQPSFALRDW
jgi:putative ABC transport system permease protein